jgi:hypothetical protein
MAGFTDSAEQKILDHFLSDPAWAPPATLYVALSSTTPTDAGATVTEPVGNGYARVATTAADWSAAAGTAPAAKTNTAVLAFPAATGAWGTVTHFAIFDALTVGNCLLFGALATPQLVGAGNTVSFAAGSIVLQVGDPGDAY